MTSPDLNARRFKKNPTDPYSRILIASERGRGVRLSAEECHSLAMDDAIVSAAQNRRCNHIPEDRDPKNKNRCRNCDMWVEDAP